MGGTILRALHVLTHLILPQTLWKWWWDYHSHVTDEEAKARQTRNLPPKHTAREQQSHDGIQVTAVSYSIVLPNSDNSLPSHSLFDETCLRTLHASVIQFPWQSVIYKVLSPFYRWKINRSTQGLEDVLTPTVLVRCATRIPPQTIWE